MVPNLEELRGGEAAKLPRTRVPELSQEVLIPLASVHPFGRLLCHPASALYFFLSLRLLVSSTDDETQPLQRCKKKLSRSDPMKTTRPHSASAVYIDIIGTKHTCICTHTRELGKAACARNLPVFRGSCSSCCHAGDPLLPEDSDAAAHAHACYLEEGGR